MDHSKLVVVQAFGTQAEADIASSLLLSAGIVATIQDAVAGIPLSLLSNSFGFRVLVRKEDGARAREVLEPPGQARVR